MGVSGYLCFLLHAHLPFVRHPEYEDSLEERWLVEALALIGRRKEAEQLFDAAAALVGPTGMLSEEYEPELGIALGNVPQAYSHLGLINAAVRLSGA